MSKRTSVVVVLAVLAVGTAYIGYREGARRARKAAVRRTPIALAATHRPPVKVITLANGRRWWPGVPKCGCVFPEIETWAPDKIDAMLDANPDCEVALVWAALAYSKQRRAREFWATVDRFEPSHFFAVAARQRWKRLRFPPPKRESVKGRQRGDRITRYPPPTE